MGLKAQHIQSGLIIFLLVPHLFTPEFYLYPSFLAPRQSTNISIPSRGTAESVVEQSSIEVFLQQIGQLSFCKKMELRKILYSVIPSRKKHQQLMQFLNQTQILLPKEYQTPPRILARSYSPLTKIVFGQVRPFNEELERMDLKQRLMAMPLEFLGNLLEVLKLKELDQEDTKDLWEIMDTLTRYRLVYESDFTQGKGVEDWDLFLKPWKKITAILDRELPALTQRIRDGFISRLEDLSFLQKMQLYAMVTNSQFMSDQESHPKLVALLEKQGVSIPEVLKERDASLLTLYPFLRTSASFLMEWTTSSDMITTFKERLDSIYRDAKSHYRDYEAEILSRQLVGLSMDQRFELLETISNSFEIKANSINFYKIAHKKILEKLQQLDLGFSYLPDLMYDDSRLYRIGNNRHGGGPSNLTRLVMNFLTNSDTGHYIQEQRGIFVQLLKRSPLSPRDFRNLMEIIQSEKQQGKILEILATKYGITVPRIFLYRVISAEFVNTSKYGPPYLLWKILQRKSNEVFTNDLLEVIQPFRPLDQWNVIDSAIAAAI